MYIGLGCNKKAEQVPIARDCPCCEVAKLRASMRPPPYGTGGWVLRNANSVSLTKSYRSTWEIMQLAPRHLAERRTGPHGAPWRAAAGYPLRVPEGLVNHIVAAARNGRHRCPRLLSPLNRFRGPS